MDWTLAITRNGEALLRMLAVLFAAAGWSDERPDQSATATLPRHLRSKILRLLKTAEAALRRLIVVVALYERFKARARAGHGTFPAAIPQGGSGGRMPGFALFDPRLDLGLREGPRLTRGNPRIWMPGDDYPVFETKPLILPDDPVCAARLYRRMQALRYALDDLPKQARRLVRWQAKREEMRAQTGKFIAPLRPGRPPGYRVRGKHPVDDILKNCHALALYALHDPP